MRKKNCICLKCQAHYDDEEKLKNHEKYCKSETVIILPEEGKNDIIKHIQPEFKLKPAICIYGDFETFPVSYSPVEENEKHRYQIHKPGGFSFFIKSSNEKVFKSVMVSHIITKENDDIAALFVHDLMKNIEFALKHFVEEGLKFSSYTPVLFHNPSRFDAHLFIKPLAAYNSLDLKTIPSNEQVYISFSKFLMINGFKHEVKFLDSFRFKSSSLDELAKSLSIKEMVNTRKHFSDKPDDILKGKGIFPCETLTALKN